MKIIIQKWFTIHLSIVNYHSITARVYIIYLRVHRTITLSSISHFRKKSKVSPGKDYFQGSSSSLETIDHRFLEGSGFLCDFWFLHQEAFVSDTKGKGRESSTYTNVWTCSKSSSIRTQGLIKVHEPNYKSVFHHTHFPFVVTRNAPNLTPWAPMGFSLGEWVEGKIHREVEGDCPVQVYPKDSHTWRGGHTSRKT